MALQWEPLAEEAIGVIRAYFKNTVKEDKDIATARIAATTLSAYTRHKQTEGARMATEFLMAREVLSTPESLQQYVKITQPNSPLVKVLPAAV